MKTIVLTMEEQKRVEVFQRVFRGEVTMAEAAMVLGVCQRHSYRIKARIRQRGHVFVQSLKLFVLQVIRFRTEMFTCE